MRQGPDRLSTQRYWRSPAPCQRRYRADRARSVGTDEQRSARPRRSRVSRRTRGRAPWRKGTTTCPTLSRLDGPAVQILRIATSPISKIMTAGNLGLQVSDKDLVAEG